MAAPAPSARLPRAKMSKESLVREQLATLLLLPGSNGILSVSSMLNCDRSTNHLFSHATY